MTDTRTPAEAQPEGLRAALKITDELIDRLTDAYDDEADKVECARVSPHCLEVALRAALAPSAPQPRFEVRDSTGLTVARLHYVTDVLEFLRNAHAGGRGGHGVWVDGDEMEGHADPDCMAWVLLKFKFPAP